MDDVKKEKKGKYESFEIEGWASDILRAEEIKCDPEKMALVSKVLDKKAKAISSIQQIKDAYSDKVKEEDEG